MSKKSPNTIALNKRARHDFFVEDSIEAGVALEGWEVKSLRQGRAQLSDSHVIIKDSEAWIIGSLITPLDTASAHTHPDPTRSRKLLLHRREINKLRGAVERKGYTIVALSLYWKQQKVKASIALAKGKKLYDKRASQKEQDWKLQKARLFKNQ